MRGGAGDPFDPSGSDESEPSGTVVLVWSMVAAVALFLAVVAWIYGLPRGAGPAETASGVRSELTTSALPSPSAAPALQPPAPAFEGGVGSYPPVEGAGDPEEVLRLSGEVSRLQVENAALRQTLSTLRLQMDGLSEKVARMEDRFGELTGSVDARRAAPPPAVVDPAPLPVDRQDTLALADPAPRRSATPFGLELGSFADLSAVKAAWRDLQRRQPGLFDGLDALATVRDRGGRTELLLVVGPVASAQEASERCERVEQAGISCLPAFYMGQALEVR